LYTIIRQSPHKMFNRVKFVLSKRISQNKGYFMDGNKKRNSIKKTTREFSTSVKPSPNGGGDNFLVVVLMCGIVFAASSGGPPPSEVPCYFDWTSPYS
jgi:hypothetical protein